MEVGGDDGAQGGEDDDDGDADDEVTPGVILHPGLGHHLPPVEAWSRWGEGAKEGGPPTQVLMAIRTMEVGGDTFSLTLGEVQVAFPALASLAPEEQGEDGEGADVDTTAGHRAEDATEEA